MSTHARSRGWWLSSSTTVFHHHLGEGLTPPHIFHGSISPHHQPASKTSNYLLVFDAGGLCTSLPPHHHPPPPKMSTCVLVLGVGLLSTSLPPTTTTENKYTCARFQWLSAILPPA